MCFGENECQLPCFAIIGTIFVSSDHGTCLGRRGSDGGGKQRIVGGDRDLRETDERRGRAQTACRRGAGRVGRLLLLLLLLELLFEGPTEDQSHNRRQKQTREANFLMHGKNI